MFKLKWFYLRNTVIGLIVAMLPSVLWAEVATCGAPGSIFAPTCQDKSIQYLTYIFGAVGNVFPNTVSLSGENQSLLANMFSVFNSTALGLGAIIIMYTLFVSTMRTAHEGETLGREWSSMWIPIRSALGISFLVPAKAAGGYSAIQVFMMWVTVQGIGAADALWIMVLDKLPESSVSTPPPTLGVTSAATTVFQSLVCMYSLDKIQHPDATAPTYRPIIRPLVPNAPPGLPIPKLYVFEAGSYGADCGTMMILPAMPNFGNIFQNATTAMLNEMIPAAQAVVFDPDNVPPMGVTRGATAYSTVIKDTISNYIAENKSRASQKAFDAAKGIGWIFAGSYYYDLARISDAVSGMSSSLSLPPAASGWDVQKLINPTRFYPITKFGEFNLYMSRGTKYIKDNNVSTSAHIGNLLGPEAASGNGKINKVLKRFNEDISKVVESFARSLSGSTGDVGTVGQVNPILAAQRFGATLLIAVESLWIGGAILISGISVALALIPFKGGAAVTAFGNIVMWFIALLAPLMLMMFTAGTFLAFYVPLIPYILFTFGAIGWLGTVIEAMVAAPLVALGVIHPEGHAVYGKAEPAIMLILNIFLRPSLMIFGLIAAMIMSYVAVGMINFGFTFSLSALGVWQKGGGTGGQTIAIGMVGITGIFAMMFIYSGIVVTAMQRTFSLIHEVPVRVLRWIAGGREAAQDYGEAQAAGEVKGGLEKGSEAGGRGIQSAQQRRGQRVASAAEEKYKGKSAKKEELGGEGEGGESGESGGGTAGGGGAGPGAIVG